MRKLTDIEIKIIEINIEKAHKKALKTCTPPNGETDFKCVDREYHRLMNQHAASAGLRVL